MMYVFKTVLKKAYESDGDDHEALDAHLLAAKIAAEGNKGPRPRRLVEKTV